MTFVDDTKVVEPQLLPPTLTVAPLTNPVPLILILALPPTGPAAAVKELITGAAAEV